MDSYQTETNKKSKDKQSVTNKSVTVSYNDIKKETIPGAIQGQNSEHKSKRVIIGFGQSTIH